MKTKLVFLTIIAVFLVGLFLLRSDSGIKQNYRESRSYKNAEQDFVTLVLDEGDGNISTYSAQAKNALETLEIAATKAAIAIDVREYDFGKFVNSINGKASTAEKAWIYFVNGESGQVAADQFEVKAGDTILWKYVKPN
jgi:hypothetical protein